MNQELLLKAALLEGDACREAWREWRGRNDLDAIDGPSHNILPLVYRNLSRHGVQGPEMDRLKAVYRYTWARNQQHLRLAEQVAREMQAQAIPVIFLKGIALLAGYYDDIAVRPMADIDLFVPLERSDQASTTLRENGWQWVVAMTEGHTELSHAKALRRVDWENVDLHWHLHSFRTRDESDAGFWEAAVNVQVGSVAAKMLSPADMLQHLLLHGVVSRNDVTIRWIPDALLVIKKSAESLDWARFVSLVIERHHVSYVRDGLRYLRDVFESSIPEWVLHRLAEQPVPRTEILEYALLQRPQTTTVHGLRNIVAYLRYTRNDPLFGRVVGYPSYLRDAWRLQSIWQVPLRGLETILRYPKRAR